MLAALAHHNARVPEQHAKFYLSCRISAASPIPKSKHMGFTNWGDGGEVFEQIGISNIVTGTLDFFQNYLIPLGFSPSMIERRE